MTNITFAGNISRNIKYVIPTYRTDDEVITGDKYKVKDKAWSVNLGDKCLLGVSKRPKKNYIMEFKFYNKKNKLIQTSKMWCKSKEYLYII